MVAFASSQGGSAFLGIAETSDNPPRADAVVPLPPVGDLPIVRKGWLQIATFPGNCIGAVFPRLSPLFPEAVAAPNILYTGFTNANAMLHVANCVANAGWIESGESYKFYAEGVTPAVARLYAAINAFLGGFGMPLAQQKPPLAPVQFRCEPARPGPVSALQGIVELGHGLLELPGDLACPGEEAEKIGHHCLRPSGAVSRRAAAQKRYPSAVSPRLTATHP
jgi:NAD/NADP octopine/nopaline dehydrogenase, alpha-helical domain